MNRAAVETDERQLPQARRSWTRLLGVWIWSSRGRYAFNLAYLVILMSFTAYASWNAALEHKVIEWRERFDQEIAKNRVATMQNRCLGFTIIGAIAHDPTQIPAWCAGIMDDLRSEPPPSVPVVALP